MSLNKCIQWVYWLILLTFWCFQILKKVFIRRLKMSPFAGFWEYFFFLQSVTEAFDLLFDNRRIVLSTGYDKIMTKWNVKQYHLMNGRMARHLSLVESFYQQATLFLFYKNQVYKNVRLQIIKNLRTCLEHSKASFLQKFKNIKLKILKI